MKDGRWYGDFRDFADGKREALKPPGERYATTDEEVAIQICVARLKELKGLRMARRVGLVSDRRLEDYAQEHLRHKVEIDRIGPKTFERKKLSNHTDSSKLSDWMKDLSKRVVGAMSFLRLLIPRR